MNILIIVIGSIVGLIIVLLIVALFVKKESIIEREIIVNKPRAEVFNYVKHIKEQDKYNKWVMADPNMKKEYKGTDGAVGFIYAWDSDNKGGKGEQEIKNLVEGERVDLEIRFEKPFKAVSTSSIQTQTVSDTQTKVKWTFKSNSKYPINLMSALFEGMLGKDLNISLNNLKAILEK
ncbi:MAG: SRPBCC family protein [Bacteroidetes bacterium]|nr:SRPBCC family protein [Bacteroidota bacterium]